MNDIGGYALHIIIIGAVFLFSFLVYNSMNNTTHVRENCTKTELVVQVKGSFNPVYDCTGVIKK